MSSATGEVAGLEVGREGGGNEARWSNIIQEVVEQSEFGWGAGAV